MTKPFLLNTSDNVTQKQRLAIRQVKVKLQVEDWTVSPDIYNPSLKIDISGIENPQKSHISEIKGFIISRITSSKFTIGYAVTCPKCNILLDVDNNGKFSCRECQTKGQTPISSNQNKLHLSEYNVKISESYQRLELELNMATSENDAPYTVSQLDSILQEIKKRISKTIKISIPIFCPQCKKTLKVISDPDYHCDECNIRVSMQIKNMKEIEDE